MNYTREQSLALTTDRYISVTANAGSGKTHVLVDRYFNILFNGDNEEAIDGRKVVAITFTRKAASEMLAKVVKRIEQEIKIASDAKSLRKLKKIRENLIYAKISTIHSFASSLLRDYPIESGVLPTFTELGKAEEVILYNDSILEVFESRFENSALKSELFYLYEYLNRNLVDEIIRKGLNEAENLNAIRDFYAQSDEDICQFYTSKIVAIAENMINTLFSKALKSAENKIGDLPSDKAQIQYAEHLENLQNLQNFPMNTAENLADFYEKFNDIMNRKVSRKNFKTEVFDEFSTFSSDDFKKEMEKIQRYTTLLNYEDELKESVKCSRILFGLIDEIYQVTSEAKKEAGYLDFNDMILKVDNLLNNENALAQIKSQIDYILVDEFQDTNPLQYNLLKKLCPKLVDPKIEDDINLFIVGDSKQSIYAFRSADVRVFKEATRNIRSANQYMIDNNKLAKNIPFNSNLIDTNESESLGDITLSASFRLNPIVATFVNKVCGSIMEFANAGSNKSEFDELTQFEVKYSPLIFAKDTSRFTSLYNELIDKKATYDFGSISFLMNLIAYKEKNTGNEIIDENIDSSDNSEEEYDYDEAVMIAKFIMDAVGGNPNYCVYKNGEYKKAEFGDIAILSRTKSGFKSITNEFLKYKIPFKLHSGSGFYAQQEIADILNYLKFIQNNNDDLAFVSLLKSPFFGFNDTDLLLISLQKANSYWDKFNIFINSIEKTNEFDYRINAFNILKEILEIALRVPLVHLLYKMINKSELYGIYQKSNSAEQIIANINKLIAIARTYEEKGFKNLYDFISDLEILSDDTSESEAAFITGENVVNIMTIHAAKGLEFPIVILSHTNTKGPRANSFYIEPQFGISFRFPVTNAEGKTDEIALHNFELASQFQKLSDIAEEKRILYVAMTRAKEHLLISASIKKKKDGSLSAPQKQLKLILEGLGIASNNIPEAEFKYEYHIQSGLDFLINNEKQHYPFDYNINFLNYRNYFGDLSIYEIEKKRMPKLVSEQVTAGVFENYISATKLLYYLHDRNQYIHRYVLGLPDDEQISYNSEDDSAINDNFKNDELNNEKDEDAKGFSAGTFIHKVMEKIPEFCNLNDEDLKIAINLEIKKIESENKKFSNSLKQRMLEEPLNIYKTKIIQKYKKLLPNSKSEIVYNLPFDYDLINATFDLYLMNEDMEWEIWDWKSNQVNSKEDIDEYKSHYEIQMKLYSFFNYLINPNQNNYIARLLFTRQAKLNAEDTEWTVEYKWNKQDMEEFRTYLSSLLMELKLLG